jgi:hypothetical protein
MNLLRYAGRSEPLVQGELKLTASLRFQLLARTLGCETVDFLNIRNVKEGCGKRGEGDEGRAERRGSPFGFRNSLQVILESMSGHN